MNEYFRLIRQAQQGFEKLAMENASNRLKNYKDRQYNITGSKPMIGVSNEMITVFYILDSIMNENSNVLILGATGTGKEMAARALHFNSPRYSSDKKGAYVTVNCAGIPHELVESILFGYVKGAFTGANPLGMKGAFECAADGTILLDEIGDMPLDLQSRLLRVVQERKVQRLGSDEDETNLGNIRILASTNTDILGLLKQGKFREDLFYRLSQVSVYMPSLNERGEGDIRELVAYFIDGQGSVSNKKELTDEVIGILTSFNYSGNVRMLENLIITAKSFGSGKVTKDLLNLSVPYLRANQGISSGFEPPLPEKETHGLTQLNNMVCDIISKEPQSVNAYRLEQILIETVLKLTGGNKAKTARFLDMAGKTLYLKLKKYETTRTRATDPAPS